MSDKKDYDQMTWEELERLMPQLEIIEISSVEEEPPPLIPSEDLVKWRSRREIAKA